MTILDILDLKERGMISLVGGGGKTTTMFTLGELLKEGGYSVLLTTTTGILNPKENGYKLDYYFIGNIEDGFRPNKGTITIYGDKLSESKLKGGDTLFLDSLMERKIFDFIIIEADGAKMLPIKAPKDTEPVIPSLNTHTIGIIGMDALGEPIKNIVHRPEYFKDIVGEDRMASNISEEDIVKLILDDRGLFKDSIGEEIVFLNKTDTTYKIDGGLEVRSILEDKGYNKKVLVGNIKTGIFY